MTDGSTSRMADKEKAAQTKTPAREYAKEQAASPEWGIAPPAQAAWVDRIQKSPRMNAQREKLQTALGSRTFEAERKVKPTPAQAERPGQDPGATGTQGRGQTGDLNTPSAAERAEEDSGSAHEEHSPDARKEGARRKLISLMAMKRDFSLRELEGVLVDLKNEFELTGARVERTGTEAKIALYASPATFLPLNPAPLSGAKGDAAAAVRASTKAGDYIKAVRWDGPFRTPGREVVKAFDDRFKGKRTTHDNGTGVVKKAKLGPYKWINYYAVEGITPNSLPLHTNTNAGNYRRAGKVEARSSVRRGRGRSGRGETVFGHFGSDEEYILTGAKGTNYNGGHLVGDQIMDSRHAFNLYEDWNLAPQVRNFNSPVYTGAIENPVTNAISKGATVQYAVLVQYPDDVYKVKPSVLIANMYGPMVSYRLQVEGAINVDQTLDAEFDLHRRTPGFWQATAEVIAGGKTMKSGRVRSRLDVVSEQNPVNVQDNQAYLPKGFEQVRYTLEVANGGGYAVQVPPAPKAPLKYNGATKVRVTARQKTF